ncbi:MAG TPA: long-chain fatty acid--CoA ligase [Methylibium sp.]|uniref:long-chain fatty acid--CoA ligase n=1 Tax=Methylibium sp. TaxID=2067992 RepID=UPI002DB55A3C|nr:long-chain fatty acid--CoA ligase [Methylibium sp.]HEU4457731.1 long-chain fatty acid--CoA ligase [Methylibium sp.]
MSAVPADRPHLKHWPARLPRELVVPETSLWFNLEVSARRYPDKPAYVFFGRTLSYRELFSQAEALAGWLEQVAGVKAGDRVALYLQNCPQYAVAYYAVLRANAVVVPVNPMNKADEFSHYIADPETVVVFASADLAAHVAAADAQQPAERRLRHLVVTRYADALPSALPADLPVPAAMAQWLAADPPLPHGGSAELPISRWLDVLAAGHVPGPHTAQPDDLALLPYTSGTTGAPKGCIHTHRTLMSNAVGGGPWGYGGPESVSLGVVPLFHITGMMYSVLGAVVLGSTVVLMPRWDRELAAALIRRHRVTHWTCIPTMIIDLFGSPNYRSFDLSSLRYLSGGGAAMPQAVAQRLLDEFGLPFAEGYGLTETAAPSHGNPPERAKLQCLGIPLYGVDSRIVDPETLRELPPGEIGEIVTHGPMVFKGYWRHAEATAAAFVKIDAPGAGDKLYFRTGDLGRMDEEGYFFLTDRLKRMINASGFKVWPAEVELMLYKHPAVQEACVIATRDAYRGESVKAVVVKRHDHPDASAQQIIDWSREQMAVYKTPREVEFVEALPKSGAGKVLWRVLQDREDAKTRA